MHVPMRLFFLSFHFFTRELQGFVLHANQTDQV